MPSRMFENSCLKLQRARHRAYLAIREVQGAVNSSNVISLFGRSGANPLTSQTPCDGHAVRLILSPLLPFLCRRTRSAMVLFF